MNDSNLIACLYPPEGKDYALALEAILMDENRSRYIPPQGGTQRHHRSRESTVSLEDEDIIDAEGNSQIFISYPSLQLTFKPGPKGSRGLEFGTHPNCDVVLPNLPHISRVHCALTFCDRELILRDFSKHGTVVEYDGKGGELRRHFQWILSGHQVLERIKSIIIRIQGISFRISIPGPDQYNRDQYNSNIDQFLQEAKANDELPLGRLGVKTLNSTVAPSGTQSPSHNIRLKLETLGTGSFAVVSRYWDVSTGKEYAYKEFKKRRLTKVFLEMWRKEAEIMRQISHEHVVSLVEEQVRPWPRLILEYVPLGSLLGVDNLSDHECVALLCQGLSALTHLHELENPIVHRDIKPDNILIQSRDPFHVKLTDFGVSRVGNKLVTFCGTPAYCAPEIYTKVTTKESYTSAVDIWSLGVVVFELAYGLPAFEDPHHFEHPEEWCRSVVESAQDWDSEPLIEFLLSAMLVVNPVLRYSAQNCYSKALEIPIPSQKRFFTAPTPTLNSESTLLGDGWLENSKFVGPHAESTLLCDGWLQNSKFVGPHAESTLLGSGWLQNSSTEAWNQTAEPPNGPLDSTPNPEECVPRATTKSVNGDDNGYMPSTGSWSACEADMAAQIQTALEQLPHPKNK